MGSDGAAAHFDPGAGIVPAQKEQEFLSPHPDGQRVFVRLQGIGDGLERLVAHGVPKAVVGGFRMV